MITTKEKLEYIIADKDIEVLIPIKDNKLLILFLKFWCLKLGFNYRKSLKQEEIYKQIINRITKSSELIKFWTIKGGLLSYQNIKNIYCPVYKKEKLYRAVIQKGSKYYKREIGPVPEYFDEKYKRYYYISGKVKLIKEEKLYFLGINFDTICA